MLVLTRKTDQELLIGADVRVRILGIQGNKVRIGISAPQETRVMRSEIFTELVANAAERLQNTTQNTR